MQCIQFEGILEEHLDEPLPPHAAAHLAACPSCRLLWSDLDAIRAAGRAIGAEDPEPPARLWPALLTRLEAEGLIQQTAAEPVLPWVGWLSWASAPRRAAVAAAAVLAAALLLAYPVASPNTTLAFSPSHAFSVADSPAIEPELSRRLDGDLQRVLASLPDRDPALATSLQNNLGIVDNLIAVCEKSVREHPGNPVAREYLYGAYQQKAILLTAAMDRSSLEAQ